MLFAIINHLLKKVMGDNPIFSCQVKSEERVKSTT